MKAVPVLLCLALAHGAIASIFKQVGLHDKVPEYIDQTVREYRNQPSVREHERFYPREHRPRTSQQEYQSPKEYDQLYSREAQQMRDQRPIQSHTGHWDEVKEPKYTEQEQYQQQLSRGQSQHPEFKEYPQQQSREQSQYPQSEQYSQQQSRSQSQYPESEQYPRHQSRGQPQLDLSAQYPQTQSGEQSEYLIREQYQQSKEQDQVQYPIYKQHQSHYQKTSNPNSGSSSSENSKESRENIKTTSLMDNIRKWTPGNFFGNQHTKFGDIVVQHGDRMSVGASLTIPNKDDILNIFGGAQKAMKHVSDEVKERFHNALQFAKQQPRDKVELNVTQLVEKYQYPVEQHTVKTDDGYELTVFRIPPNKQTRDVQKRPVVFLMHGIDGSADDWLLMGPQNSLAFLLSDAGYDVWLGNARGNKYSQRHVSKHPAVWDFWQYSIDEIALHDLPAMIDYALETTKQEKLYYIGHSTGTTVFFALTSTIPEYNDKIIMMYALSPMVYMNNVRSPVFRMIAPTSNLFTRLEQQLGFGRFLPGKELIMNVGGALLEKLIGCKELASNIYFVMTGVNFENMEPQVISMVMNHLPAGTSTKVIKQYGQAVASQQFRRYDYGPKINMQVYGNEQPPTYDMERVQAPVTLYYSEDDWLAHPKDVERLVKELPNVKESHKVSDAHFSNMDFQFSKYAPEVVYRRLIASMQDNQ